MSELFSIPSLMTLCMLVLLQAVLGFDNLLYISLESKRVAESDQQQVRRLGIGLAIGLRIVLLLVVIQAISFLKGYTLLEFESVPIGAVFDGHSLIVLFGGIFILYTAIKEIFHMLSLEEAHGHGAGAQRSFGAALFWIILMNLVFSFDSILSAMAIAPKDTDGHYPMYSVIIMATAIVISGVLMIVLADTVSEFLKKNRMYEVLGLFVLFIVGILLISEGGHLAHIHLFSYKVEAMSKSTFYFVLVIMVLIDIVQGRYQRKLLAEKVTTGKQLH
ncbi:MAG: hypothetical protein KDA87_09885 [Planctomycetales bacterium]|nr:hypothetical protein [Planctomycetales bacterium]